MFGRDTKRSFLGGDDDSALGGDCGGTGARVVRERKANAKANAKAKARMPLDSGSC